MGTRKGYAIEIKIFRWTVDKDDKAIHVMEDAYYDGSLSRQQAKEKFEDLVNLAKAVKRG